MQWVQGLAVARSPFETQQFWGVHLVALPVLVNRVDFSQSQPLLLHPAHHWFLVSLAACCLSQPLSVPTLFALELQLSFLQLDTAGGTCLAAFPPSQPAPQWAAMQTWGEANAQQGELMCWLWTMHQPQLASPRMRLSLSCRSSSHCVSPDCN